MKQRKKTAKESLNLKVTVRIGITFSSGLCLYSDENIKTHSDNRQNKVFELRAQTCEFQGQKFEEMKINLIELHVPSLT